MAMKVEIKKHQNLPLEKVSWIENILAKSPILKLIKVEVEFLAPGFACLRLPFRREIIQGFGVVQGGVISALGDATSGIAFLTLIEPTEAVITIDLKINFLAPVRDFDIICESRIIHRGSLISLADFEIKTPEGLLTAKGSTTLISKAIKEWGDTKNADQKEEALFKNSKKFFANFS